MDSSLTKEKAVTSDSISFLQVFLADSKVPVPCASNMVAKSHEPAVSCELAHL